VIGGLLFKGETPNGICALPAWNTMGRLHKQRVAIKLPTHIDTDSIAVEQLMLQSAYFLVKSMAPS